MRNILEQILSAQSVAQQDNRWDGYTAMKKCSFCKQMKPFTEFNISNKGDGFQYTCKHCSRAYYKAYNTARKAAKATVIVDAKVCRDCGLKKPISQFGKKSNVPDKHQIYCKPCWKDRCYKAQKRFVNGR